MPATNSLRLIATIFLLAGLLGCIAAPSAHAQRPTPPAETKSDIISVMSGPRQIKLRIPPGECALERSHPADNRLITTTERLLQNVNALHVTTVNCKTLRDWRAGRRRNLSEYTQVQTQLVPDTVDHKGKERTLIKASCEVMRQHGVNVASGVNDELDRRLSAGRDRVKLAGNAFLGVLAEDLNGCYLGLLVRLVPEGSSEVVERLAIYAHVILAGRTTFLYRFSADVTPQSLKRLIEDRKAAAAEHVALNGGYGTEL